MTRHKLELRLAIEKFRTHGIALSIDEMAEEAGWSQPQTSKVLKKLYPDGCRYKATFKENRPEGIRLGGEHLGEVEASYMPEDHDDRIDADLDGRNILRKHRGIRYVARGRDLTGQTPAIS